MSRTTRWYIFQRSPGTPGGPGGLYRIEGWGKVDSAVRARVDKLDPRCEGHAFRLVAADRRQAIRRARELFNVRVEVFRRVAVADLHVRCSIKVRCLDQPGYAMSDSCGASAQCAVEMPSLDKMWRCWEHHDQRWVEGGDPGVYPPGTSRFGDVHETVFRWVEAK